MGGWDGFERTDALIGVYNFMYINYFNRWLGGPEQNVGP